MELNITAFYNQSNPREYSASVAEIGDNAGKITWQAACNAPYDILDNEDKRDAFRAYIKGFGAWDSKEIAAFTHDELNGLLIQLISGDIRESCLASGGSWADYQAESEAGQVSGNLFQADNGDIYYYIGG